MLSLLFMTLTTYHWCIFALSKLSIGHNFPSRRQLKFFQIPLVIVAFVLAVSPWTGWAFTITSDGKYVRGPLFAYISGLEFLYNIIVCVCACVSYRKEKNLEKKKLFMTFGLAVIFPVAAGLVQIFVVETPILAPAVVAELLVVFINILSSQNYNDALTGLNNRKKLFAFLEDQTLTTASESTLTIYMMDVNSFKKINDTYGHIEGDNALRLLSQCLIELSDRYGLFIAKFGGDEFVMIEYRQNQIDPDTLISEVNELLKSKCESKPYIMSVSIGYAVVNRTNLIPEGAINLADRKLYEAKEIYKSRRGI